MTQNDLGTIAGSTTGTELATALNNYRDSVNSSHAGSSRPSYAVASMIWVKTVSATAHEIYYYDGTDDILMGTVNPTTNVFSPSVTGILNTVQGSDIASASTLNLDAATGNLVDVTGSTSVTAVTLAQGRWRIVRFTGALTLTNGASLVLPGGANITTAAGDYAIFVGYASSVVRVSFFQRAAFLPQNTAALTTSINEAKGANIAGGSTTNIWSTDGNLVHVTGTPTITSFGTAAQAGAERVVVFDGVSTITHNGTSLICPGGANIVTAAGDVATVRAETTANARIVAFTRASGEALVVPVVDTGWTSNSTATATTSGTSIDFTGIPSAAKTIILTWANWSTNGTSIPIIQIGDSGGVEVSGYAGSVSFASSISLMSTGFSLVQSSGFGSSNTYQTGVTLALHDASTNTWACWGISSFSNLAANCMLFSGTKSLSAALDRIRLTMTNGTDAFDAGSVNILYQ